jgi:hypothetical protein
MKKRKPKTRRELEDLIRDVGNRAMQKVAEKFSYLRTFSPSELSPETLKDPIVEGLLRDKQPVNRENYLLRSGLEGPLDPELEAEMPVDLRKRLR